MNRPSSSSLSPAPAANPAEGVRRGDWLVILSALFFSTMPVFGALAYSAGMGLLSLLAWRFLLASIIVWSLLAATGRVRRLPPGRVWGFLGMGAAHLVMAGLYFQALKTAPVSTLTLLFYTYPAVTALLAATLLGERLTGIRIAALILALAGVAVVMRPSELGQGTGLVLALAASLMYAGFIVVGTRLMKGVDTMLATAWILSVCAGAFGCAAVVRGEMTPPASPAGWGILLGITAISTVLADVCFFYGLPRTGASRAAILSTLEPVCTLLLSVLLLGESIPPGRYLGGVLILGSVILTHRE